MAETISNDPKVELYNAGKVKGDNVIDGMTYNLGDGTMMHVQASNFRGAGASGSWHGTNAQDAPVVLQSPLKGMWDSFSDAVSGVWTSAVVKPVQGAVVQYTIPEITVQGIPRNIENASFDAELRRKKMLQIGVALAAVAAFIAYRRAR